MMGPIAIEIVAEPTPDADAVRVLLDACTEAAGPQGCVSGSAADVPSRARVLVVFSNGNLRLRVEMEALAADGAPGPSRVATFRAEDPMPERFRAAGLIAAGLVTSESARADGLSGAPAAEGTLVASEVLLRAGVGTGVTDERSWAYAQFGTDFRVAGPFDVGLDVGYARTWSRDTSGITQQRLSFGAGPGIALPLVPRRLELRARIEGELQQLRADVTQPSTGRQDASGRTLVGLAGEVDLDIPLGAGLELFLGDRVAGWGSATSVRVQNVPVETIGSWLEVAIVGLNVRLP